MSGIFPELLFAAVVEITNKCNLRCPHCASDSGCAREDEMSLDELDEAWLEYYSRQEEAHHGHK